MLSFLRRRRPSPALIVAALALAVALGGVAVAAIPSSDGVIHGCYKQHKGQLRVVDAASGQHCRRSEVALAWNQQGPAGPQGAAGQSGRGEGPAVELGRVEITAGNATGCGLGAPSGLTISSNLGALCRFLEDEVG